MVRFVYSTKGQLAPTAGIDHPCASRSVPRVSLRGASRYGFLSLSGGRVTRLIGSSVGPARPAGRRYRRRITRGHRHGSNADGNYSGPVAARLMSGLGRELALLPCTIPRGSDYFSDQTVSRRCGPVHGAVEVCRRVERGATSPRRHTMPTGRRRSVRRRHAAVCDELQSASRQQSRYPALGVAIVADIRSIAVVSSRFVPVSRPQRNPPRMAPKR
jgi:hypothetical protein